MPITQSRLKELFHYDLSTGEFFRLRKGEYAKTPNSIASHGYKTICIDGKNYLSHRLAWLYEYGSIPKYIDHIDRDKLNNSISNLRECTNQENSQNINKCNQNNKTGFLGVSFDKKRNKYRASIQNNGKHIHIGRFDTQEEARNAYIAKKREIHCFFTG